MQKRILLVADIDERRLESILKVSNLALVDAAHHAWVVHALNGQVLELSLDRHRHAGLKGFRIDEDLLVGVLYRPKYSLHLADEFLRRALYFFGDGLGGFFRQIHRRKITIARLPFFATGPPALGLGTSVAIFLITKLALRLGRIRVGVRRQPVRLVLGANDFLLVLFRVVDFILRRLDRLDIFPGL